jgi:hypothetical protein
VLVVLFIDPRLLIPKPGNQQYPYAIFKTQGRASNPAPQPRPEPSLY